MFKPSQHPTFNMVYNMLYDMFERFAPTLWSLLKVNNKDTKTMPMAYIWHISNISHVTGDCKEFIKISWHELSKN